MSEHSSSSYSEDSKEAILSEASEQGELTAVASGGIAGEGTSTEVSEGSGTAGGGAAIAPDVQATNGATVVETVGGGVEESGVVVDPAETDSVDGVEAENAGEVVEERGGEVVIAEANPVAETAREVGEESGVAVAAAEEKPVVEAYQPPTKNVGPVFQILYFLANLTIWIAKFPFTQVILPIQIMLLMHVGKVDDPVVTTNLSIVVSLGSLCGLIANPIAGALSDRTTSRWGRRRPWMLSGLICAALMLSVLAFVPSIALMVVEWCLYQIAINIVLCAVLAVLPDKVPSRQRGFISSFTGFSIPLGLVIGTLVITPVFLKDNPPTTGELQRVYFFITALLVVVILAFALTFKDSVLPKSAVKPLHWRKFLAGFWISPRKYPNFGFAWITRFLVITSSVVVTIFITPFLQRILGLDTSAAAKSASNFNTIYGVVLIICALISGFLSDKFRRRKIFVIIAGIIVAISMLILAFAGSWGMVIAGAVTFGMGYGIYLGVDFALATEVLPSQETRAKDLGVFNIANTLPQVLVPYMVSGILLLTNSYLIVFVVVGIAALLSGLLIIPIKNVR